MFKGFNKFIILGVFTVVLMLLTGCGDIIDAIDDSDGIFGADTEEVEGENNDNGENNEEESGKNEKETNENVSEEDLEGLEVQYIDVGQGDATLLQYDDKNILIDTGDWNNDSALEYLEEQGIEDIDLLVGSHAHSDHIGKMDEIITEYNVEEVWMEGNEASSQVYERTMDAIDEEDVNYVEPEAGDEFNIGTLDIDVLSPKSLTGNLNDDSLVMKLTYGNVEFLFTGDAEEGSEAEMVGSGEDLSADILKVGHHGSDTSSTEDFVEAVNPDVAIMQVGEDNKYDHPMQSVIDRYLNIDADLYATKDNGTIVVETDGEDYSTKVEKEGEVTAESE